MVDRSDHIMITSSCRKRRRGDEQAAAHRAILELIPVQFRARLQYPGTSSNPTILRSPAMDTWPESVTVTPRRITRVGVILKSSGSTNQNLSLPEILFGYRRVYRIRGVSPKLCRFRAVPASFFGGSPTARRDSSLNQGGDDIICATHTPDSRGPKAPKRTRAAFEEVAAGTRHSVLLHLSIRGHVAG